jgi:hypothetical protein
MHAAYQSLIKNRTLYLVSFLAFYQKQSDQHAHPLPMFDDTSDGVMSKCEQHDKLAFKLEYL